MPIKIQDIITPDIPADAEKALADIMSELDAMPAERIQQRVTLDAGLAGQTVLGNLGDIARLRAEIDGTFGSEGLRKVQRLPIVATACIQANVNYRYAMQMPDLTGLAKEVSTHQNLLFIDALSLANRGLLNLEEVEHLKAGQGYKVQYESLIALVALFRAAWSRVASQTPVTTEVLDTSQAVAVKMATALGKRDQQEAFHEASDVRHRAISMLIRNYEEVRAMVIFLRHFDGDADVFAPSLWAVARTGGKKEDGVGEPASPSPSPSPVTGDPVDPDKDPDPSDPFV